MKKFTYSLFLVLYSLLLSPVSFATPVCESAATDPDGDGWGYEYGVSCLVQTPDTGPCDYSLAHQYNGWGWNPATRTSCPPIKNQCVDPDGDGWGWDGTQSCFNAAFELEQFTTPSRRLALYPQFSNDANRAIYTVSLGSSSNVRLLDRETGIETLLTNTTEGHGSDRSLDISADGTHVLFSTTSSLDFINADIRSNGKAQIVLHNTDSGGNKIISAASDGSIGNAHSHNARISDNGRIAVLVSSATNLVSTAGRYRVYIRDMQTNETRALANTFDGSPPNAFTSIFDMSDDGRYVVVFSRATNLSFSAVSVTNLYIYDTTVNEIVAAVPLPAEIDVSGRPNSASITDDGSKLVFGYGYDTQNGADMPQGSEIFMYDRLSNTSVLVANNATADTYFQNGYSRSVKITSDGRYVAFTSENRTLQKEITAYSHQRQLYLADLRTSEITLISRAHRNLSDGHGWSDSPQFTRNNSHLYFNSMADNLVSDYASHSRVHIFNMTDL